MRKRKNKDSIDETSEGYLLGKTTEKHCSKKNRKFFFQKQNQKKLSKVKRENRTERKPPKPPQKKELNHQ